MKDLFGKTLIRKGNINQRPCLVYVRGENSLGFLVCDELNTYSLLMSNPDDLIPYSYNKLIEMQLEWDVEAAKRRISLAEKALQEFKNETGKGGSKILLECMPLDDVLDDSINDDMS